MGKTKKKNVTILNSEEGYDRYANLYGKSHAFLNTFEKGEFYSILGDIKGKKILDVGCGDGRLTEWLLMSGAEVYAADISGNMIKKIEGKFSKIKAFVCDIKEMPFEDNFFDLVISAFVIVHLKTLPEAFDEVYRVLKPGGSFVLSNINQKKAPVLELGQADFIIINSFYHRPENVVKALEDSLFNIENNGFIYEGEEWINQIIKATKN